MMTNSWVVRLVLRCTPDGVLAVLPNCGASADSWEFLI